MREGPHKVAIEEYIVTPDGNEVVIKRWPSIMECCLELGMDHATIRHRLVSTKGQVTSMGVFKYRRVKK